ncbi:hypothetical protein N0V82_002523 [Gnomoniopsis sp. IMI 355080]|nr:hypothetical protein N0V82_002523 [Gnomoniopsis sp. IMI 355080]
MPPRVIKRKSKAATGDDDDLWDVPSGQPMKRTRTSGLRNTGSRIDEDSENAGQKAVKQFQSWAEWQKKFNNKEKDDKRQFAANFKENIEESREIIQLLINKSSESLTVVGKKQTELLKDACAKIEATTTPKSNSNSKEGLPKARQDLPLFKAGQDLLNKSRDLVAVHEKANSKASALGNAHTNERRTLWKADMEQAQKAVLYSAQYGEKAIRCNVDMSSNEDTKTQLLSPPWQVLNSPGQMALDMHQRSIDKLARGEATWADETLKYMGKFAGIAAICELQGQDV